MVHFNYIWFDKQRKMYYIGTHSGSIDDQYVSSSKWFSGEVNYRPSDFKRRVISYYESKEAARQAEARLLSYIKEEEFGTKYYNLKNGRKKGTPASNKGKPMTEEQKKKISAQMKGKPKTEEHKKALSVSRKRSVGLQGGPDPVSDQAAKL